GTAAIIEALTVVRENNLPCRDIEIVFSIAEEAGMLGSSAFDFSGVKGRESVVLDGSGNVGTITVSAPGELILEATVIGKSSHAGAAPELGISSIQTAARGVAAMNLLRIDEETTCNIGTFKSEGANNIVPAKTVISAEIRSRNLDKLNAQAQHMVSCLQKACDDSGARLEYTLTTAYTAFELAEDTPLISRVKKACESIGCSPVVRPGGGGSDANTMNALGMTAVVLGTGMSKVHTPDEFITVKSLTDTARLVLALMTD
ncbi:MAG: M20/M25/M40 family metallo-hydrolase, partial [Pyramidobacter sp.]|nr:M20/M25/M40 family metallo-hydrolase [Pyramidobacter sp.]